MLKFKDFDTLTDSFFDIASIVGNILIAHKILIVYFYLENF